MREKGRIAEMMETKTEEDVILTEDVVTREEGVTEIVEVVPEVEVSVVENEVVSEAVKLEPSVVEKDKEPEAEESVVSVKAVVPSLKEVIEVEKKKPVIGEITMNVVEKAQLEEEPKKRKSLREK